jgi:hypothetical protein
LHGFNGSKDRFLNDFVNDKIINAPMNEHVLEYWKLRDQPNVLFLFYEDMKKDLKKEVLKVMKFLDKNYCDEQIDQLCAHLDFNSMKNNPSVNKEDELEENKKFLEDKAVEDENSHFIRKGKVGSYKEELSAEQNAKFDEYVKYPDFEKHNFAYKFD